MISMQKNPAYELNIQTNGTIGGWSDHEYEYPAPLPETTEQASGNRSLKHRMRAVTVIAIFTISFVIPCSCCRSTEPCHGF